YIVCNSHLITTSCCATIVSVALASSTSSCPSLIASNTLPMTKYLTPPLLFNVQSTVPLCFFFSSRRRHTRSTRDWSSDVCSSDLARYLQSYMMAAVGERVVARLRRELQTHIPSLPLSFFSGVHSADLMSRILTDVTRLARLSSGVLVMAVRQLGTIVALLVVMVAREWALTLTALVAFPAIALIVRTIGRRLHSINKRTQERVAQLAVLLHESFSGTKIVKAFGRERHEQERFDALNDRLLNLSLKNVRADELTEPLMEIAGALGIMAALWYGGY